MAESADQRRRDREQITRLAAEHENATRQLQDAAAARDRAQEESRDCSNSSMLPAARRIESRERGSSSRASPARQLRQKSAELDRLREAGSALERELAASRRAAEESARRPTGARGARRQQADELLKSGAELQAESARRLEAEKSAAQLQAQVAEGEKAEAENERLRQQIAELQQRSPNATPSAGGFQAQAKELTAAQRAVEGGVGPRSAPGGRRRLTRPRDFERKSRTRRRREAKSRACARNSRRGCRADRRTGPVQIGPRPNARRAEEGAR